MSELPEAKPERDIAIDGDWAHYERILEPNEFAEAFVYYLHYLYNDRPVVMESMLKHFTNDRLLGIQKQHRYTNVEMSESYKQPPAEKK